MMFPLIVIPIHQIVKKCKDTILSLANKLQDGNMKDEKTLSEVVDEIATMTGKNISKEKKEKIINTIMKDKVPDNVDKMFQETASFFF